MTVLWTGRLSRRSWELCENRGGRPGLPVPNSLDGLSGRKATLEEARAMPEDLESVLDGPLDEEQTQ